MLLHTLLRQLDPGLSLEQIPNCQIRSIQEDSRKIQPGDLFVARPGAKADGSRFAADAQAKGAVAVVTQQPIPGCSLLPQVTVTDAAVASSVLAHAFVSQPSHK